MHLSFTNLTRVHKYIFQFHYPYTITTLALLFRCRGSRQLSLGWSRKKEWMLCISNIRRSIIIDYCKNNEYFFMFTLLWSQNFEVGIAYYHFSFFFWILHASIGKNMSSQKSISYYFPPWHVIIEIDMFVNIIILI